MTTIQDIETAALGLALDDREHLAEMLMASLDVAPEAGYAPAWDDEIGRRVEECRNGTAELLSVEEVKANLKSIRHESAR